MWLFDFLSSKSKTPKDKTPKQEWQDVPGKLAKYYEFNSKGEVRSKGLEFDMHIENGCDEVMSAWLTAGYLEGFFNDSKQKHNIQMIRGVLKKILDEQRTEKIKQRIASNP